MPMVNSTAKGQIVIPKEIRKELGIKPGQKLFLKVVENHAEIIPVPEDPVKAFCGIFEKGSSLTNALLKQRKEETTIEEEKIAGFVRHNDVSKKRR